MKFSIKIDGYKMGCHFLLRKRLKNRAGTYPLYCRLTFKRKYTAFPVLGAYRFRTMGECPETLLQNLFDEITTSFKEVSSYKKEFRMKAFHQRYKRLIGGDHVLSSIDISLIVAHLHNCCESNLITPSQLNQCKAKLFASVP